jgi:hypothetical protein
MLAPSVNSALSFAPKQPHTKSNGQRLEKRRMRRAVVARPVAIRAGTH